MNVAQALADRSARNNWQHNPAYLVGSSSWTHGQVHGLAARAATVLAERGVRPRQHVLLSMPDGIAWIATFLALARLGAVAVTTNPRLTVVDHTFIAEDCRAQLVITDSPERFDGVRCLDAGELLARAETSPLAAAQAVPAHAPLYVQYTSGTTGRPIGVPHRHADLEHYHRAVGSAMLHMTEADVSLSVSKLHFAYGFGNSFVYPLLSGSAAVLLPEHPAPSTVAEAIDRHLVSVLHAVPSAYANLLAEIDGQRFPSLRVAVSAGERLAAELGKRLTDILGAPVLDELGCTEVGGAFCANTLDSPGPGTLGFALPGYQVRLRDDSGRDIVDCGVDGELWVTGPTLLATTSTSRNAPRRRCATDG
ncbi:AMP-binding protein [Saccharopolyspora spinosa]|uniref:AMP-binding protein n=1 Tax=Saccharopolyspora spinosa TaxID=60894 RepID=UPI00376F011F